MTTTTRRRRRITLTVTGPDQPVREVDDRGPSFPWLPAALVGALGSVLSGWLLAMGVVLLAWFSAMSMPMLDAARFATLVWLGAHGAGLTLGNNLMTVVPLGLTLLFMVLVSGAAGFAGRQAVSAETGMVPRQVRRRLAGQAAGVVAGVYAVAVGVLALLFGAPGQSFRAMAGSLLLAIVSAVPGAALGAGWDPRRDVPRWLRRVPQGAGAAFAALIGTGAAALGYSLWLHADRARELEAALAPSGPTGSVTLTLVSLMFLPNTIVWATSYCTGAGLTLGAGTLLTPGVQQVGLLPSLPLLAAVPTESFGEWAQAWLATSAIAGLIAGAVAVRRGTRNPVHALGAGVLAALLAAAGIVGLAAVSGGDIGVQRLVGLGPRLTELAMIVPGLLVGGAAVGSLVAWLIRRGHPAQAGPYDTGAVPQVDGQDEDVPLDDDAGEDREAEATVPLEDDEASTQALPRDDDEETAVLRGR